MKKGLIIGLVIILIIAGVIAAFYLMRAPAPVEKAGNASQGTVSGEGSIVSIKNLKFNPATVNIAVGEKVTWRNEDAFTHDVTIDNGLFDKDIESGDSFTYVFNQTGAYDYHCDIHPEMKGRIVVS